MTPNSSPRGDAVGSAHLIVDIVAQVLRNAENPEKAGREITGELRDLTGARTALLAQYSHESSGDEHTVVAVSPSRRRALAESTDIQRLAQLAHDLVKPAVWRAEGDHGEAQRIISRMGVGSSIATPLATGSTKVGCVMLLGIPDDPHGMPLVLRSLEVLSTTLALVFRIAKHTFELTSSNKALQASEEQVRLLLESTAEAIYGLDLNGNCTFCNPACLRMLGYERSAQLLSKSMHELIHHTRPDGTPYPMEECRIYEAFQRGEGTHVDDEIFWRADRTSFPAEYWSYPIRRNGGVVGSVVTFLNITERKQAEEALRAERDKLESVFAAMNDGVYIANREYDIEYVNPVLVAEFGPYEGRKCYAYFHDRQDVCPWCRNPDVFAGKTVQWEWTSPKSGKTYDLVDTPLTNADGSISKLEIFRDITERKRADQALRESERRFRSLGALSPAGIYRTDAEGHCLYVNEKWCEMAGLTPDQASGNGWIEGIHPDDRDRVAALWHEHVMDAEPWQLEYRFRRADGKVTWILGSASVLRDSEGRTIGHIGVDADISERKRAEVERERLLHNMGERVKELRCMYGVAESIRKRETLEQVFEDVVALIPPGWHYPEITRGRIRFDDREYVSQPFEESAYRQSADIVIAGERRGTVEVFCLEECPELDEGPFLKEERDLIDGIARALSEAVEHKRAAVALRESEERYALTELAVNDGLWDWDILTHADYLSPRWKAILGYSDDELPNVDSTFFNLIHPDDEAVVNEAIRSHLEERKRYAIEFRLRHKDGSYRWVLSRGEAVRDATDRPVRMVGSMTDITARKQAEKALRKAERMAATGLMAAQVAHEINNPLAGIKTSFGLIRDAVPDEHPDRDMVERIDREIDRIAHVVREMYTLYSPRSQTPSNENLAECIRHVLVILEPLRREHEVTIDTERVPEELTVRLPRASLHQILQNLLANAIEASGDGQTISVAADLTDDAVKISVRDQGKGIPQEIQHRIFEPLVTSKTDAVSTKGMGLGLATVKNTIEALDGKVEFETTPNHGTVFHVFLPLELVST